MQQPTFSKKFTLLVRKLSGFAQHCGTNYEHLSLSHVCAKRCLNGQHTVKSEGWYIHERTLLKILSQQENRVSFALLFMFLHKTSL